jgi:hypothetical protein
MSNLLPVASVLNDIAQRFGLSGKLLEHRLQRHWPEIVGQHVAGHTRPESIRFKKLYVIADSSVWVQQLAFLKPSLLESINAAAGGPIVTDIVLRVGEVECEAVTNSLDSSSAPANVVPSVTPEFLAQASIHAQAVEDPDIRARLAEVMARALATSSDSKKFR